MIRRLYRGRRQPYAQSAALSFGGGGARAGRVARHRGLSLRPPIGTLAAPKRSNHWTIDHGADDEHGPSSAGRLAMCGIVATRRDKAGWQRTRWTVRWGALHDRGRDAQSTWVSPRDNVALGQTRPNVMRPRGPTTNPCKTRSNAFTSSSKVSSTTTSVLRKSSKATVISCARTPTTRAPRISTKTSARNAHIVARRARFHDWDDRTQKLFAARDRFGVLTSKNTQCDELASTLLLSRGARTDIGLTLTIPSSASPALWQRQR